MTKYKVYVTKHIRYICNMLIYILGRGCLETFRVLMVLFLVLTVFYFSDYYFLHFFEVKDTVTGNKIHTFQMVYGMYGLAFGFYLIHLHGVLEGKGEGYDEGLREGYERGLNSG